MKANIFVPALSTPAGSCLTMADWQQAGIRHIALQLEQLVMKPGIEVLDKISDLHHYYGWRGELTLNAVFTVPERDGVYTFRSQYDGQRIQLSVAELFRLITHLQPNQVILPRESARYYTEYWQYLPTAVRCFFAGDDILPPEAERGGRYAEYEKEQSWQDFTAQIQRLQGPLYLMGAFNVEQLLQIDADFIESNQPADDAMRGLLYQRSGSFDILDAGQVNQHEVIDPSCCCITCSSCLTRASLHHLLQNTPLLCQRFLIQHNIWQARQFCSSQYTCD